MKKNLFTPHFKVFLKIVCVVSVLILVLMALQRLLVPKYTKDSPEGALVSEYYKSEKNNDIIFFGDSEMYYNFSPVVLKEEFGVNGYVRGSANQTIWQSYYLICDTLQYEKPDIIVVNVSSMMKENVESEAYNRMTMEGMKWSEYKYKAIKASMLPEESLITYIFPILRYHSRWSELKKEDFTEFFGSGVVSEGGFLPRYESVPAGTLPTVRPLENYDFPEKCYYYLEKITKLCQEQHIELVLVKSPSIYPHWYDEWDEQIASYSEKHNIKYVNMLDYIEAAGIDFEKDTFDGGLHLNVYGAEKNTIYFGSLLFGK